jgi:hypothetical protein
MSIDWCLLGGLASCSSAGIIAKPRRAEVSGKTVEVSAEKTNNIHVSSTECRAKSQHKDS